LADQAFPDQGGAFAPLSRTTGKPMPLSSGQAQWDVDVSAERPTWAEGLKRQGQPADPNMSTGAPDAGAPAERIFPTKPRTVRGGI
jgi:hypothetical protein